MSTTPRIPPEFARGFTMLAEDSDSPAARIGIPAELTRLAGIPIATERSIQIDPVVHESIRLFSAFYQGCTYCQNARQAVAVQAGLNEDMVSQLRNYEASDLPPKVKAALRVADKIASAPQLMDDAAWAEALETYTETELVDIVLFSCFTTGSRVAIILGVEPGPEASSRIFYPTDPVYGESEDLVRAVEKLRAQGIAVREAGEGYDPIGTAIGGGAAKR
jgi:alkylhydroperoxidase family enzyme